MVMIYHKYREEKCKPFLLESLGPQTPYSSRSILGIRPTRTLTCKNGRLYDGAQDIGTALDIFSHLELTKSNSFFPAWLGFFSYEFGRHFGLPSKTLSGTFPEAAFYLYEEGFVSNERLSSPLAKGGREDFSQVHFHAEDNFPNGFSNVSGSIARGDVYQVNLAQRFSFDASTIDFLELYERLRVNNPAPFMGLIEDDDWAIACASPERLFRLHEGVISSRPIAGTRKRGMSAVEDLALERELLSSPKERAEHAMLVDLVRNDLARICETSSVHVDESFIVERYSHVMHLVSEISGRTSRSLQDIFASIFPAGTITGTPKESAMQHIRDLEIFARGPYTGSMGYISSGEGADFNILIRSAYREGKQGSIWAGAGIVAQSEAGFEQKEVATKAQSVTHVLSQTKSPSTPALPQPGTRHPRPTISKHFNHRVLFVENHDSFSHNIVDAVRSLGCTVEVVDHCTLPNVEDYRHVILGPGPNRPEEAGNLMSWLGAGVEHQCAVLGICLGHQALGVHFGARLIQARRAIHGECETLTHLNHPLFQDVPTQFAGMRYHSLALTDIPACFDVTCFSQSDEVMGIAHKTLPLFGLQFHPESFLSDGGLTIFANFLESV
jgi:anthranilate synthase